MDDGNENFYDNRVVKTTSMYPPSSASGILDDIGRPMDGGNENQSQGRSVMDEDMARRACLLKHETTSVSKRPKPVKTTTVSKKEKQPIWPGAKLASLFKSLFTNGNSKKTKKRKAKSTQSCTCSWASTRSAAVRESLKGHAKNAMVLRNENASGNEDDYDDAASSDSSSDLFELDHLAFTGNNNKVIQPPSGLQCSQLVLAPKGLGTALVTASDIGFSPPLAATSVKIRRLRYKITESRMPGEVQVAEVDWIKITSPEELSLMEGSLQSIDLLAGIDDGSTFSSSQYIYMSIRVHIEDHVVELVDSDDFPSLIDGYVKAQNFIIWARHIGVTTLYVSARQQSGREILSQPIKVEVYAPPTLHPSDIFLVPGASYVLTVRGGPTIGAYVEYASMEDGTATIHRSSGRLSAVSPGNTVSLFCRCGLLSVLSTFYQWPQFDSEKGHSVRQNPSHSIPSMGSLFRLQVELPNIGPRLTNLTEPNGLTWHFVKGTVVATVYGNGDIMICHAHGQVRVGIPSSVKLNAQSDQLAGNLFSFYELCKNYQWTVDDEKVLIFKVAEHLHDDKYGIPTARLKEITSTSYLDEKDLGFIEVLYGSYA
ncbi:hypothetical protein CsSME_00032736 [Camellia sinensis var. sinensis]